MSITSLFSLDKDKDKDRAKQAFKHETPAENQAESAEKHPKGPTATIGKGIRKMLFWKEKEHGHGTNAAGRNYRNRGASPTLSRG